MFCIGHLSIADTFSKDQSSSVIAKPLYFEPLNSGQLSIKDKFFENQWCPILKGFTVIIFVQVTKSLVDNLFNHDIIDKDLLIL